MLIAFQAGTGVFLPMREDFDFLQNVFATYSYATSKVLVELVAVKMPVHAVCLER